jgi:hypothetical protein
MPFIRCHQISNPKPEFISKNRRYLGKKFTVNRDDFNGSAARLGQRFLAPPMPTALPSLKHLANALRIPTSISNQLKHTRHVRLPQTVVQDQPSSTHRALASQSCDRF